MWPWEHAIVGYVAYSLLVRLGYRDTPGGLEAFVVVFASVLPDVIDKPLAWEFGVFETGYALGHSIFFAVPLAILVGLAARTADRPRVGLAFAIGYLLHLPSDVLDTYARGGSADFELVLWPLVSGETGPTDRPPGFSETFLRLFDGYQTAILTGELSTYLWLQFGLAAVAALLWLADGAPVLRDLLVGGVRLAVAVRDRLTESPQRR